MVKKDNVWGNWGQRKVTNFVLVYFLVLMSYVEIASFLAIAERWSHNPLSVSSQTAYRF